MEGLEKALLTHAQLISLFGLLSRLQDAIVTLLGQLSCMFYRRPPRSTSCKFHRSHPVLRMPAVACQYVSNRTGVGILRLEDLVVGLLRLLASSSPPIVCRRPLELWTTCLALLLFLDRLPVALW